MAITGSLDYFKRNGIEHLFHRPFAAARLDLIIPDRFGNPIKPKKCSLVPLQVTDVTDNVDQRFRTTVNSLVGYVILGLTDP